MEKKWDTVTPADLKKTLCKWDVYVPLVTKGLNMWCEVPCFCHNWGKNISVT